MSTAKPQAKKPVAAVAKISAADDKKVAQIRETFPKVSKEQAALHLGEHKGSVTQVCNALADGKGEGAFRWKTPAAKPAAKPAAAAAAAAAPAAGAAVNGRAPRPTTAPAARRDEKKPFAGKPQGERKDFPKKDFAPHKDSPLGQLNAAAAIVTAPAGKKVEEAKPAAGGSVKAAASVWSAAKVDKGLSFADRVRAKPEPVVVEAPKPVAAKKKPAAAAAPAAAAPAAAAPVAAAAAPAAATADKPAVEDEAKEKKPRRERKPKKDGDAPSSADPKVATPAAPRTAPIAVSTPAPLDPLVQSPASHPSAPPPTPAVAPAPATHKMQKSAAQKRFAALTQAVSLPAHVSAAIRGASREIVFSSTSPSAAPEVTAAAAPVQEGTFVDKWTGTAYKQPVNPAAGGAANAQFHPQAARPLAQGGYNAGAGSSWNMAAATNNNNNWNQPKPQQQQAAGRQAYLGHQHYGGVPPGPPLGGAGRYGGGNFSYGAVSNAGAPTAAAGAGPGAAPGAEASQLRFSQHGSHGAGLW